MRGQKQYTIQTITKRVDRESGRHRTPRAPREPAVCEGGKVRYDFSHENKLAHVWWSRS
jgi:hypothetical protein